MRFTVEQLLPAEPEAVWPFITDPAKMNLWSKAHVRFLTPGDGPEPWRIGTLRQITIKSGRRRIRFDEVIQDASPGKFLVYRVIGGVPVRYHRGEIRLTPTGNGTRLAWEVAIQFPVPGMGIPARMLLESQLKESLEALAKVVKGQPAVSYPVSEFPDESAELPALFDAAREIMLEQRRLADELAQRNDPKQWFVRVYEFVTECQMAACRRGDFAHPAWVLRLIPRFHHYYIVNFNRWRAQEQHACEQHWASSFLAMDMAKKWKGEGMGEIGYGIAKGMQAHIEEDLPRTLAEIYHWHYRGICEYGRFRADYLLMAGIFREASSKLLDLVPKEALPMRNRLLEKYLPPELKDSLMAKYYYDIARERRRAFERGERLARLMAGDAGSTRNV